MGLIIIVFEKIVLEQLKGFALGPFSIEFLTRVFEEAV
jgi:hypothetical protein